MKLATMAITAVAATTSVYADGSVFQIDVPAGATNEFTEAQIAALTSGAYDVLAKRGDGCLVGTNAISSFAGEIRIEKGAYWVRFNGELGAADGLTSVSNGATLYVESPTSVGENTLSFSGETFHFAGDGTSGEGALCNRSPRNQYNLFKSCRLEFRDDTVFTSKFRLDAIGTQASPGVWDFGGHSFTYRGVDPSGIRVFVNQYGVFTNMADFTVNRITLGMFSTASWHPGAGSTFALENNAELITGQGRPYMYRGDAGVWRSGLSLASGAKLTTADSNANYSRPFENCASGTNVLNFAGPISLSGTTTVRGNGYGVPFTFGGPVSGSGTLNVTAQRLQFACGANTYSGSIVVMGDAVTNSGLRLYKGANLPPCDGRAITMSDAQLRLDDYGTFDVGPFAFSGDCEIVGGLATGAVRSVMSALTKTGGGTLMVDASLDVPGETRIDGGTLKLGLPKVGNPGLGEGWFKCKRSGEPDAVTTGYDSYYRQNAGTWNNANLGYCSIWRREGPAAVLSRAEWFFWKHVHYHGYVWNRTDETVRWNVAGSVGRWSHLYIDGAEVVKPASDAIRVGTVELSPGAHEIEISLTATYDSTKDSIDSDKWFPGPSTGLSPENWWPWKTCGIAYDPTGNTTSLGSTAAAANTAIRASFLPFRDPGDGSLFTIDNKTPDQIDQTQYLPAFSNLVMAAGTTFDLNGNTRLSVPRLTGQPLVTNGTLTVCERWTLSASDLVNGVSLSVKEGPIVFADGVVMDVDDPAALNAAHGSFHAGRVIATADGGIYGMPSTSPAIGEKWLLEKSSDGKSLMLRYGKGLMLILK